MADNDAKKHDPLMRTDAPKEGALEWHSPKAPPFRLAGWRGLRRKASIAGCRWHPKRPLPEAVDGLANNTAGAQIGFQSDSAHVSVRVMLLGPANMDHMPATGQCGFDCVRRPAGRPALFQDGENRREDGGLRVFPVRRGRAGAAELHAEFPALPGRGGSERRPRRGRASAAVAAVRAAPAGGRVRHFDYAGRVRGAAGHGLDEHPQPAAERRVHQPRLLRQRPGRAGGGRNDLPRSRIRRASSSTSRPIPAGSGRCGSGSRSSSASCGSGIRRSRSW